MASSWPGSLDTFVNYPYIDNVDFVLAAEANQWVQALQALESGLGFGANDPLVSAVYGTYSTLGQRLAALDTVAANNLQLDHAAGDIQNVGTAPQAGASGKAADAKHVHGGVATSSASILTSPVRSASAGSSGLLPDANHQHQAPAIAFTSGTLPVLPYPGQIVYETDTGHTVLYNGVGWTHLSPEYVSDSQNTSLSVTVNGTAGAATLIASNVLVFAIPVSGSVELSATFMAFVDQDSPLFVGFALHGSQTIVGSPRFILDSSAVGNWPITAYHTVLFQGQSPGTFFSLDFLAWKGGATAHVIVADNSYYGPLTCTARACL